MVIENFCNNLHVVVNNRCQYNMMKTEIPPIKVNMKLSFVDTT